MRYIKVTNEYYTDSSTARLEEGIWKPARPELLYPTVFERVMHLFGGHITFGQPYCVICGKCEDLENV